MMLKPSIRQYNVINVILFERDCHARHLAQGRVEDSQRHKQMNCRIVGEMLLLILLNYISVWPGFCGLVTN